MPSPRSLIQLVRRRLKNSAALPGPRSPRLQDMAIEDLLDAFTDLKQLRRTNPDQVLLKLGAFGAEALAILAHKTSSHRIAWEGAGQKDYKVFSDVGDHASWSRAVNTSLFIEDVATFGTIFQQFATRVIDDRGKLRVEGLTADQIDMSVYTTVMSFAVLVDIYQPSRGLGGTFFEMIVGPLISLLTGRIETGDVVLPVPGREETETVKVDLTFHDPQGGVSLAVPTKISTRERISQAFVHARILETARPGSYRNILCVVNENNAFTYKGRSRGTPSNVYLRDTLVPGTIALYQRYVASLDGFYYLDPPEQYLAGQRAGLPPVKRFSSLLLGDLEKLLA